MGYPTPNACGLLSVLLFSIVAPALHGHYREHPNEATRPPEILQQPEFTEIPIGEDGALHVHAIGAGTLGYQWYHNGELVKGVNSSTLRIVDAKVEDSGFYSVAIYSAFGTTRSDRVRLRIVRPDQVQVINRQQTGDHETVSAIEYHDGYFYASDEDGVLTRSIDGYAWETLEASPGRITELISGDDRLISIMPLGEIASTEDFESWGSTLVDPESRDIEHAVHSLGTFAVLVNTVSTTRLLTSVDGSNWVLQHEFAEGPASNLLLASDGFIVAARSTTDGTEFVSTVNGSEWNVSLDEGITQIQKGFSTEDTVWLVGGTASYTSSDGTNWAYSEALNFEGIEKIEKQDGIYYGLYKNGVYTTRDGWLYTIRLLTSTNLETWSIMDSSHLLLSHDHVIFETGEGGIVYGPIQGSLYPVESSVGIPLLRNGGVLRDLGDYLTITDVQYLVDRFVVTFYSSAPFVGGKHSQIQSINSKHWTATESERFEGLRSLAFGNGVYATGQLVGSDFNNLRFSREQVTFEPKRLLFGNGKFVGISGDNIWYSNNGDDWNKAANGFLYYRLFFAHDRFFSQGETGMIAQSSDGSTWTVHSAADPSTGADLIFADIGYLNGRFIGVEKATAGFRVYESIDGFSWDRLEVDFEPLLSLSPLVDANDSAEPLSYTDLVFSDTRVYFLLPGGFADTADFRDWETTPYNTHGLFEIAYGEGSLVAVSYSRDIVSFGTFPSNPPRVAFRNRRPISATPYEKVNLLVDAFDVDGEIQNVAFYLDGRKVREVGHPPFDWEWAPSKTGIFDLTAIATDSSGLKAIDGVTARVSQNIAVSAFDRATLPTVVDIATLYDSAFALGANGLIYRSDDLLDWQLVFTPPFGTPSSLDSTSSLLYAPTADGVYVCHDGKNWVHMTDRSPQFYKREGEWFWSGYSRSNEYFLEISPDLYNWSRSKISTDIDLRIFGLAGEVDGRLLFNFSSFTFEEPYVVDAWGTASRLDFPLSGGVAYASHADGYNYIWGEGLNGKSLYRSTSLGNWSFINTPSVGSVSRFEKINEIFILEGSASESQLPLNYLSSDGLLSWSETGNFGPIVYRDGRYAGILDSGIVYSEDGAAWTRSTSPLEVGEDSNLAGISEGFLLLDANGGLHASSDGVEWTAVNQPGVGDGIEDIAHNGTLYVAVSEIEMYASQDGVEWSLLPKPDSMKASIAARDGLFVANAEYGAVFVSSDGVSWTKHPVGEGVDSIHSVEYLPEVDLFILETHTELVWTSSNGTDWASDSGFGGGQFRLLGDRLFVYYDGVYSTSDGSDFQLIPHLTSNEHIQYVKGVYLSPVYLGPEEGSALLRSVDGIEWETVESPDPDGSLTVINEGFVMVNSGLGSDSFSEDGLDWVPISLEFPGDVSVVAGGRRWYLDRVPGSEIGSLYTTTRTDLSLERLQWLPPYSELGNTLRFRVSVRNQGLEMVNLSGTTVQARYSEAGNWIGSTSRMVGENTLPDRELDPGEVAVFDLAFHLSEATSGETSTIQLMLNPERITPEVELSNNYTWLRLLPAPKVAVDNQPDGTLSVEWSREGGYVKRVEYSYDLENWFLLEAPAESEEAGTHTENVDPDLKRFYRVRAE